MIKMQGGVFGAVTFFEHRNWHGLEAPNEIRPRKRFQHVVGRIDFPPIETIARRALVAVVIVVPAFT